MKLTIQLIDDAGGVFAGEAILERVSGSGEVQVAKKTKAGKHFSGKITCSSAIERLWRAEKFKKALSFQDVKTALTGEGYNFPQNTVMMALQGAGFLTKHGSRGSYTWTQKYPFNN